MQTFVQLIKCAVPTLALAIVAVAQAEEALVWQTEARLVPPPRGASTMLRNTIGRSAAPNRASRMTAPQTTEQWEAALAKRAADRAIDIEQLQERVGVTISRDSIAGVPVYWVKPNKVAAARAGNLFVYIHGGAYVSGGGDASVGEAAMIAAASGIPTLSVDYRMPPEHPFPAAIDDVAKVYRVLLKDRGAGTMAIGGTSAGGGLSLAAVHHFKALNLPVPGAIYAGTPWADLSKTGDTLYTNEGLDRILVTYDGLLAASARLYANGKDLKDPLISPVYGDFSGFPPTYLVTGTRDLFLSDTARTHRKLRNAGVTADLNVYEGLSHAEYAIVVGSPEWTQTYAELAAFLHQHLD